VLRAIEESGDVPLRPVELQTRLALPQRRMARLIDCLDKGSSDTRGRFVVLTDSGRRLSKDATFVLCASLPRYSYRKRRT
jgi:DNA-binding MarR family transcriptional regulator